MQHGSSQFNAYNSGIRNAAQNQVMPQGSRDRNATQYAITMLSKPKHPCTQVPSPQRPMLIAKNSASHPVLLIHHTIGR